MWWSLYSHGTDVLATIPNPASKAPPGLSSSVTMIMGWVKWGLWIACGVSVLIVGYKLALGQRGRSSSAVDGAMQMPWIAIAVALGTGGIGLLNALAGA